MSVAAENTIFVCFGQCSSSVPVGRKLAHAANTRDPLDASPPPRADRPTGHPLRPPTATTTLAPSWPAVPLVASCIVRPKPNHSLWMRDLSLTQRPLLQLILTSISYGLECRTSTVVGRAVMHRGILFCGHIHHGHGGATARSRVLIAT